MNLSAGHYMEHGLKLGESVRVGGFFLTERKIIYAGEVSPGVFSIAAEWSRGNNSSAYNLYFQRTQGSLQVFGGTLTVLDASRHEMRFRYEK